MTERRLLPHLAATCCELLGETDARKIPPAVRVDVAQKARVAQYTVDRFLRAETVPRSRDLDSMVTAVAEVARREWLDPWKGAVLRAEDAKDDFADFLSRDAAEKLGDAMGELPPDQETAALAAEQAVEGAAEESDPVPAQKRGTRGPTEKKRQGG